MSVALQFVGSNDLGSLIIELKGAGRFSHVDLVMPNGQLLGARSDSCGGAPPGVQIRPNYYESWNAISRITITGTDAQEQAFWAFALDQVGKAYDKEAILGFVLNRDWHDPSKWYCSELAMAAVEQMNIFDFPLAMPCNKVDPDTAFAILSTYGQVTAIR